MSWLFKFQIFLEEIDWLWHLFFREQYTFILQTSSDVIDFTCMI